MSFQSSIGDVVFLCVALFLSNSAMAGSNSTKQPAATGTSISLLTTLPKTNNETVVHGQFKDWNMRCNLETADSVGRCELSTKMIESDGSGNKTTFDMTITIDTQQKDALAYVKTPLQLLLSQGSKLKVDKKVLGKLAFHSCHKDGCLLPFSFQGSIRSRLKSGNHASFTFKTLENKEQVVVFSLRGISQALKVAQTNLR